MMITTSGLPREPFQPLFALDDAELHQHGIRRMFAPHEAGIGYPCRISLAFAQAGEELLLLNYRHLDYAHSPYRAEGPIFIRRQATQFRWQGEWPEIVMQRAMSVRAYDHEGIMVEADLAEKDVLKGLASEWLARSDVAHVDIHSARRGCFFCRLTAA
ncbi:MAG: DUF1203 domain-containing protein [Rhabdaerophilum sp.]